MRKTSLSLRLVLLLVLLKIAGCAAPSPPTPPLIADPVKLTPLPLSVQKIDSQSSGPYLNKVSDFLLKVGALSKGETPK